LETSVRPDIHVRDYGAALWKRKWLALTAFAAVVVPVVIYIAFIQVPTYQSSTTLMVKVQGKQAQLFDEARPITPVDVDTEIEIMKSPPVLARPASIFETAGLEPKKWIDKIEWLRVEQTPVVHITVEAPTPVLARDVANALGESYIDYSRRTMLDSSRTAMMWLERQLADAQARLRRDRQRLQDFCKAHPGSNFGANAEMGAAVHQALMEEYMEIEYQHAAAKTAFDEFSSLLQECGIPEPGSPMDAHRRLAFAGKAEPEKLSMLAALSDSERLAAITAELDAARAALDEKLKVLKPGHPEAVELAARVAMLEKHYRAAFVTECRKGYMRRRGMLHSLEKMLQSKKQELVDFRKQFYGGSGESMEFAVLERNAEASQMLYNTVLEKLKEFDLSQGATSESARFIQPATLGVLKNPQNGIKLAFALLCGMLLAVGTALLVEYFDTTLKTTEDVERELQLAVLGTLPDTQGPTRLKDSQESDLLVVLD